MLTIIYDVESCPKIVPRRTHRPRQTNKFSLQHSLRQISVAEQDLHHLAQQPVLILDGVGGAGPGRYQIGTINADWRV
jgi:hypothetical protein